MKQAFPYHFTVERLWPCSTKIGQALNGKFGPPGHEGRWLAAISEDFDMTNQTVVTTAEFWFKDENDALLARLTV